MTIPSFGAMDRALTPITPRSLDLHQLTTARCLTAADRYDASAEILGLTGGRIEFDATEFAYGAGATLPSFQHHLIN